MRSMTSAAADLGLGDGDALRSQLEDSEEERKKRLLRLGSAPPSDYGDNLLAAASLGIGGKRG